MKVEETKFVTFYSFKGGVGRSMALVNTAYLLYKSGRKVLIIDADLEAPGLWNVKSFEYDKKRKGFVEFILEYKKRCNEYLEHMEQAPESDYPKEKIIPDLKEYITSVKIEEIKDKSEGYGPGGKIDIMPAGIKNNKYSEKLLSVNFEELFAKYSGSVFFQETRERIRNKKEYDYVLIDSRTGFSDAGDICTHELCDYLIVLTGLNDQNIGGTKSFLDKWKEIAGDIEKKEIALVATPVPFGEEELKNERLEKAREILGKNIDLEILYHPRLALIEEPFVFNWPQSPIALSYENITKQVRQWGDDDVGVWFEKFNELFSKEKYNDALNYIKERLILDKRNAITHLRTLTYQFVPTNERFREHSLPYYELLSQNEPPNAATYSNWGAALADLGKKKEAIEKYKKAIEIKPNMNEAYFNWGNALLDLGKIENNTQFINEAIEKYKKALEIKPDDHDAYTNRGIALADLGKIENNPNLFKEAIEKYKKAVEIKPDDHDAYTNWGNALLDLGKHKESIEKYKKAVEIKPDKHEAYFNWGDALLNLGKLEKNTGYYQQAIEILKKGEKINPEAMSYNLACAYSLLNKPQLALKYLKKAFEYEPHFRKMASEDEGFAPLKDNPEFVALVSQTKKALP
jgi:tetratricopeptide (TPR) repeat protein